MQTKPNQITLKVIVAAKEVDIIDGYAENQNISKFGWLLIGAGSTGW